MVERERQQPIPVYLSTYRTVKDMKGEQTFDELIAEWADQYGDDR